MSAEITYRWINFWEATESEVAQIDRIIEQHGWVKLNLNTTRVLVAEESGRICGFSVVQMMPYVGPLYVNKFHRAEGVAEALADKTMEFLKEVDARGWIVVADSEHVERICTDRGMQQLSSPVYITTSIPITEVLQQRMDEYLDDIQNGVYPPRHMAKLGQKLSTYADVMRKER